MSGVHGVAPDRVFVLCAAGQEGPPLEDLIRSEGYEVERAASVADADYVLASAASTKILLFESRLPGLARENWAELKERYPGSRLLVLLPDGESPPTDWDAGPQGPNGDLWLTGAADEPGNAESIRRFLQGEGYRWGSDLVLETGLRARLVGGVSRRVAGKREEEAHKLVRFASELSQCTDLDTLLRDALSRYLEVLDCQAGSIYVWDQDAQKLILRAAEGPEQDERLGLQQQLGEGLAGWVAEAGEPMLVTDARKVHRLRGRPSGRYATCACIAAPIKHDEQLVGVVCLTMRRDNKPFLPEDLQLLHSLSQKLGALMQPVILLREMRQLNDRLLNVMMTCSNLAAEKDTQVEALRVLSSDILDGIPVGVIAYDRKLRVCFANAAAEEVFKGASNAPVAQGRLPLEDTLDVDDAAWREKLLSTVEKGERFRLERVGRRAGGPAGVLDIRGCPLTDSDGTPLGGILTVQDVSADVEMEAKLSSAERLALVGTIAAKVAHELNNPLDGIHRFLSLALRQIEESPDKARSCLGEVRQGLLRMGNIVGQLLAFSRRHRTGARNASLSQVLRDVVVLYEERARAAGIDIATDVPLDLPPCRGAEVFDVFSNMMKNALDAMPDGGRLTIACRREEDGARFTFSDTGPGVPQQIRDSIFEPFFTTKRDGSGTGLGLALCRDAIDRIGGSVALCQSERGACFEVFVPTAGQGKE